LVRLSGACRGPSRQGAFGNIFNIRTKDKFSLLPSNLLRNGHFQVRAFAEWPGTRAAFQICSSSGEVQNIELKVVTTRIGSSLNNGGHEVSLVNGALAVPCSKGSALEILQLQPPAKKVMTGRDFYNGLRGRKLMIDADRSLKQSALVNS
jgi:methionyl-tRNA formyltransferase